MNIKIVAVTNRNTTTNTLIIQTAAVTIHTSTIPVTAMTSANVMSIPTDMSIITVIAIITRIITNTITNMTIAASTAKQNYTVTILSAVY